jgi:hypothetical protein
VESNLSRRKIEEDLEKRENDRQITQLQVALAWLCADDHLQEDDLARLVQRRYPGTCDWIMNASQFQEWLADKGKIPMLWIWGIPGSGTWTATQIVS